METMFFTIGWVISLGGFYAIFKMKKFVLDTDLAFGLPAQME